MTTPAWSAAQSARRRSGPALLLSGLAVLLAAAALIVACLAFIRSSADPTPHYTDAERAQAKTELCERYKLAAQAVHIETNGPDSDVALARIANTNGAAILDAAASNKALDSAYRDAARALAESYLTVTATGTFGKDDQRFWSAVDDSNSKFEILKGLCSD